MDEPFPRGDARLRILHLEDSRLDADLVRATLDRAGVRADVTHVDTEPGFLAALAAGPPDLVLADYMLPDYDGLTALAEVRRRFPDLPFICVSGTMGEEIAVECLKRGATDYVLKQRLERLAPAVRLAVAEARERAERVRTEAALRESEDRFRRLSDSAPVLIWVSAPDGAVEYANRPFVGFTGTAPEDLDGTGWAAVVHPDDRADAAAEYLAAHRDARPFRRVVRVRRVADGRWRWLQAVGTPRATPDGRFAGMVGTLTDVTDLKRAEEAAREADKRKDEFLAVLAHELRNPLAPIRNALQIMKLAAHNPGAAAAAREMIERQVAHMVRLIDDLLDVSRINRDKIVLRREPVDLAAAVAAALDNCRPAVAAAGHTLAVDLPPAPVTLHADPARLHQVFTNLLNNAVKYTPAGGRIGVAAGVAGGDVEFRVSDSGIGIAASDRDRIFEPFAQAGRVPGTAADGLGVGLALVRRLAGLHGGTVAADSAGPGRGSTFTVRLPLHPADEPAAPGGPGAAPSPGGSASSSAVIPAPKRRVLVVDDVADSADSLGELLRLMGLEVCVVTDGRAALDAAHRFRPDVALMDIGMPGMDGLEVARRLRAGGVLPDRAVLVAVTGFGQADDHRRTREAGFDAHLVKPVDPDELRRVVGG